MDGIGRVRVLALAIVGFTGVFAWRASAEEGLPKSLNCSFTSGTSWSYEAGDFKSKTPTALSFTIDRIDLEAQSAALNAGADGTGAKLSVVRAINANHFLEAVNEGFLNLTTVYDKDASNGKYPAVHSRHFGLLGQPVFSQYTGFCTGR
jgi:hypothetical protein